MAGLLLSLLAKALEKVFWHILDCWVLVNGGQDLVVVTEQPVQHEQWEGRRGGVCIDHNVFQCPIVLEGGGPKKSRVLPAISPGEIRDIPEAELDYELMPTP